MKAKWFYMLLNKEADRTLFAFTPQLLLDIPRLLLDTLRLLLDIPRLLLDTLRLLLDTPRLLLDICVCSILDVY